MRALWEEIRQVPPERRFLGRGETLASIQNDLASRLSSLRLTKTEALKTIQIWNAFIQELLSNMDLPNNDRDLRALKLLRMQPREVKALLPDGTTQLVSALSPQKQAKIISGSHDSHSLLEWIRVSGITPTQGAIPHAQIQSIYALERAAGEESFFAGDGENEVAADGAMVPWKVQRTTGTPHVGPDATKWDLDLSHLRPDDGSLD
jgi:hypothetical protein